MLPGAATPAERLVISEGGTPSPSVHPRQIKEIYGNNVTVSHITVTDPQGGDGDGVRFFGNDIAIVDNVQTFADDTPPSQRVLIEGNRCERVDNMCLMAEGPTDGEGDGEGHTTDFTIRAAPCEPKGLVTIPTTLELISPLPRNHVTCLHLHNRTHAAKVIADATPLPTQPRARSPPWDHPDSGTRGLAHNGRGPEEGM